ncbi:MAG: SDR family NAD(P)-dependent oxidoreductase [Planctomycetes bacterium]|nr:SDR family NAD(P)-dependent oxidoreductase [Planctomycetota bacterium]
MNRTLRDRVVVVTGASRGLGRQIALACAGRGARVGLLARSAEPLQEVAAAVAALGSDARAWPMDVRDAAAVRATVDEVIARWGRIDVLVNAAGAKIEGPVEQADPDDVRRLFEVNCLGPMTLCQAVLPHMRRQGCGHVVNVSSVLGKRATPMRGAYAASKAALNALTDALRTEVRGTGIRVTLVCSGRLAPGSTNGLLVSSEQGAAERIVRCIERPSREVVLTAAARVLVGLNVLMPGVVDWIVTRWRTGEERS